MTGIVVADTGPLIALARAGYLDILPAMYQEVLIPPAVHDELCLSSNRPGSKRIAEAIEQGWLHIRKLSSKTASLSELILILDLGEAEAIVFAEEVKCRFLLIDERKGRAIAKQRGVPIAGVAGVLLAAKKQGFVDEILPIIKHLEKVGYRLSSALMKEIGNLSGE